MAETQRPLATILANLPDNTSGQISPEDVRDAVVSLGGGFGGMHGDSTNIGSFDVSTETLIDFWDTLLPADVDSDVAASLSTERIVFNTAGTYQIHLHIHAGVTAGREVEVYIALNGTTGPASALNDCLMRTVSNASSHFHMTLTTIATFSASDFIDARGNAYGAGGPVFWNSAGSTFWAKRLD